MSHFNDPARSGSSQPGVVAIFSLYLLYTTTLKRKLTNSRKLLIKGKTKIKMESFSCCHLFPQKQRKEIAECKSHYTSRIKLTLSILQRHTSPPPLRATSHYHNKTTQYGVYLCDEE